MAVHEPGDPFVTMSWKWGMFVAADSFYDYYRRAGTKMIQCINVTGTPNAGAYTTEFATLTGAVEVLRFWSFFYNADTVTGAPTKLHYDLYDQTNVVDITLDGVDATGAIVNSKLGRIDKSTAAINFMDSDQVRIVDGAVGLELSAPFVASAKYGADTRMRLCYTTDGNPVDFTICHKIVWRTLIESYGRLRPYWA